MKGYNRGVNSTILHCMSVQSLTRTLNSPIVHCEIHKESTELDTQEMLPVCIDLLLCEAASDNQAHLSYLLISNLIL